MCLPAVCFIIVIISSFVSLANAIWIPSTWVLHSKSARRSRRAQAAFSSPSQTHSLFQSHRSQQPWKYHRIMLLFFIQICLCKNSCVQAVRTASCDLEEQGITPEKKRKKKKVLFRIPAPYILISNLALKSPEDDHILLLPPIEKYFSTSRGNLS